MKKIDSSNIAGTAKAPFLKATFDHNNEAVQETIGYLIRASIPDSWATGKIVILYGCEVTPSIPGTSSITAGAAYYAGEIYEVEANASLITTGSQTLVWAIETTYASGDPVQYSDGSSHNQHAIRRLKLQAGLTGTGIFDYDDTDNILLYKYQSDNSVSGSVFSTTNITGTPTVTYKYILDGGLCHISLRANLKVTTGASSAICKIDLAPALSRPSNTYGATGTWGIHNVTTGAFYTAGMFGANVPGCIIDSNGRLEIQTGFAGPFSDGDDVTFTVTFTQTRL